MGKNTSNFPDNKNCRLVGIWVGPLRARVNYAFIIAQRSFSDWLLFLRQLRRRVCSDTSGDMTRAIYRELNDARRLVSSMTDGS